jgi:hypothetical protein
MRKRVGGFGPRFCQYDNLAFSCSERARARMYCISIIVEGVYHMCYRVFFYFFFLSVLYLFGLVYLCRINDLKRESDSRTDLYLVSRLV